MESFYWFEPSVGVVCKRDTEANMDAGAALVGTTLDHGALAKMEAAVAAACKPISVRDLAAYIAGCLTNEDRWNQILPIGGPGPAITPRQQGEALFEMLGQAPKFSSVPVGMISAIIGVLSALGKIVPSLAAKAELAKIGRYYATESMLVLDPATGRYSADATPETGSDTLFDHYRAIITGEIAPDDRGDHAVF